MVNLEHVQQDGKEKCGAACLEMIFKHYKIPYKKDDIWDSIKTHRPGSYKMYASTQNIVKYSLHCGLSAVAYQANADAWANVLDKLDELSIPAVLSVRYRNTTFGHFIVYSGKKNNDYLFHDPELKKAPVRYDLLRVKDMWTYRSKEVTGLVYILFGGETIPYACTSCGKEYPILRPDEALFSKISFCPHCDARNMPILNLE